MAQIVLNVEGDILDKENFFNSEFIRNNKIKQISGAYMIKRDGESLKNLPGKIKYSFNEHGLLEDLYQVSELAGFRDTTHVIYRYTKTGLVKERIEYNASTYNSHQLVYNDIGRVVGEMNYRVRDLDENPEVFVPGEKHLVSSTRYSWTDVNDTTLEKTCYNNNSLPYQKEIVCTNEDGFLIQCKRQYVTTKDSKVIHYKYNKESWISEKEVRKSNSNEVEFYRYNYDKLGMLLKESYFLSAQELKFKELLYKDDGMLEAIIEKDIETGEINICKYTTTYF